MLCWLAAGHCIPGRECHGVQQTDQGKGPWATSAQGWCLLCPLSRPSCGPAVPTRRIRAAVYSCSHRAQGFHWAPGLQPGPVHLGAPASWDRCAGQSCCGEMKGVSRLARPAELGFFSTLPACPLLPSQGNVDCLGDKQVTEASMRLD